MGMDITTYVEIYKPNTDKKWHIAPVKAKVSYIFTDVEDKWEWASPWDTRNTQLFNILTSDDNEGGIGSVRGLPDNVSDEVKEIHKMFERGEGETADISFNTSFFTLSELKLALRDKKRFNKGAKIYDPDTGEDEYCGVRPVLKDFVKSIEFFANLDGDYHPDYCVRVVFWFTW